MGRDPVVDFLVIPSLPYLRLRVSDRNWGPRDRRGGEREVKGERERGRVKKKGDGRRENRPGVGVMREVRVVEGESTGKMRERKLKSTPERDPVFLSLLEKNPLLSLRNPLLK